MDCTWGTAITGILAKDLGEEQMANDKTPPKNVITNDGHTIIKKGFQPTKAPPATTPAPQGGHQPITSGGGSGPGTPPNQGSGGKK